MRPGRILAPAATALLAACTSGEGVPGGVPPTLNGLAPGLASTQTVLRLSGSGLGGDDVRVYFGEREGVVLSAEATEVWASGVPAPEGAGSVDVSVAVDGLRSNALPLALGASGSLRPLVENGLQSPRGLVLDAGGGLVWIFDEENGVLVFAIANGAYRVHLPPSPALSRPVTGAAVSETELLVVDASTNSILAMDVDTASTTPHVTGLASAPTALALDTAGNLYWADGGPSIGRRTAAGAVDPLFAAVPAAFGVAVAGGVLYATDPLGGAVHRVELPTAVVTTGFATGVAGARGISGDGTGVVVCVADAGGAGAVRVSDAGLVTAAAPERAFPGIGSASCDVGSGTIWSIGSDGGIESSKSGAAWRLRAPVTATDAAEAVWTDARLYLLADRRCAAGGTGAIIEVVGAGSFRSKASGVCARDAIHERRDAGLVWVDRTDATARRLDLATGTVVVVASDGAFAGALGAAANADGVLFVADGAGDLRMYDEGGFEVALVSTAARRPVFSETLYFERNEDLWAGVFNHGDFLGIRFVRSFATVGIRDLAPRRGGGVVVRYGATDVGIVDSQGTLTLVGASDLEDRIGLTPFGELFRTQDGQAPVAVLP